MGRYAIEPDNATKSAKAKGSNLRWFDLYLFVKYIFCIMMIFSLVRVYDPSDSPQRTDVFFTQYL